KAGLLLGAAVLFRPALVAWGLGLGLHVLLWQSGSRSRRFLALTAVAVGVLLVLAPWAYRNYRIFGVVVPISTNGGYNLYLGNNSSAWAGGWMVLEDEKELRALDELEGDREARRRAIWWARENPVAYAKVSIRRTLTWLSVAPDYGPGIRLTS